MATDDQWFLVVDFEFTAYADTFGRPKGFFPEIIEEGAVQLRPPDYADGRTYESFVKPRFFPRLSEFCRGLAIIEQADVDAGVDAKEMLASLAQLSDPDKTWFAAWGDSDYTVLANQCRKYGLANPFPSERSIDLAAAYRDLCGHTHRSPLAVALAEKGIEQTGYAHTALADALNTAALLRRMLSDGWKI
ncbi:MAG TPA: exonuclease domain-containing protein [Deltaproteobacteria bacterium]|nr:exonuclease domain-containing protein [Deltaproteobacteria bacterium]